MDIQQFFRHMHVSPIFRTTRELTVETKIFVAGNAPFDPQTEVIPAGTELRVNAYSNFGYGYSMTPLQPRKVFKGVKRDQRFFVCPYDAMEFVRYEEGN